MERKISSQGCRIWSQFDVVMLDPEFEHPPKKSFQFCHFGLSKSFKGKLDLRLEIQQVLLGEGSNGHGLRGRRLMIL